MSADAAEAADTPDTSTTIEQRLAELDITLPEPAKAVATYVPYAQTGNTVIVSGQLPMHDGTPEYLGKVGKDVSLEDAQKAAALCAVNILAQIRDALDGDWSRLVRCVRLGGFVNCTDDYTDQPKVINGASELINTVLQDQGRHARAAVGVSSLPLGVSVEVEATFEVK